MKEEKLREPISFLKRKFKSLYVPATIVYVLAILFHNVFVRVGWYPIGYNHPGNHLPFRYYDLQDCALGCVKAILCAGSGELVMGAMWFLYVLLYSFIGLSILSFLLKKLMKSERDVLNTRLIILFVLAAISSYLTNKMDFTISRLSQTLTVMLLIVLGKLINQKLKWTYTNNYALVGCVILFTYIIVMFEYTPSLAKNRYSDVLTLMVGGSCAIYILGTLYNKICRTYFARIVCYVGRESLYIMMFHVVGLFICNSLFEYMGLFAKDSVKGIYTYNLNSYPLLIACYLVMGVGFPLLAINIYRCLKRVFWGKVLKYPI